MKRRVEAEWLDELAPEEPQAASSRQDLQRLNRWMGHTKLWVQLLHSACPRGTSRLVELGAGDGSLLLEVARRLGQGWQETHAVLVDRHSVMGAETRSAFERLGWRMEVLEADVFGWLRSPAALCEVMVANLFLHHFTDDQLAGLLEGVSKRARVFIAVEPRRWAGALMLSRLVGFIGCNEVTRHDAPVSVRAGFAGQELSRLWPTKGFWALREGRAGWASHFFLAQWRS